MSKKTPLLDLLRSVPKDATQVYHKYYDGSSQNIPYGSLCSNAAKRIEELEKLCCDLESELTSVWSDVHSENKVFIVERYGQDFTDILGVFDCWLKADSYLKRYENKHNFKLSIEEYRVD